MLVHGAGGSSRHWEPMIAELKTGFPLAVDLPGHGATDGYVPDSIDAAADFLNAFLNELEIQRPICYIGQSMGGLIGLQFALTYPTRLNRLVLMATAARIQLHPDFLQQAVTGQWDIAFLHQSFAPEVPEEQKELVLSQFRQTRLKPNASDFMGVTLKDLSQDISALQIPTLILTGDDDVIISPRKSTMLQRQIPGSRLVTVPGAGHYLHVEKSEKIAEEIMHFLQGEPIASL
jgi:pimeloyl-ACP methyl ester carboxylesterase